MDIKIRYEKVLKSSLVPTIALLVLSLLSIILTTHYWILGDWIMGRWVPVPSQFKEKNKFPTDDVIVSWTEPSTNATIISGCLNWTAAVMAIVAWVKLSNHELDTDFNTPLRRFWLASVLVTGIAGVTSAIAAIAIHYTDKGPDEWGCTTEASRTVSGVPFTNLFCSREMGACNFIKPHLKGKEKEWAANIACNETVVVKWLQIILIVAGVGVMAIFATQAKLRTNTRWSRHLKEPRQNPL